MANHAMAPNAEYRLDEAGGAFDLVALRVGVGVGGRERRRRRLRV